MKKRKEQTRIMKMVKKAIIPIFIFLLGAFFGVLYGYVSARNDNEYDEYNRIKELQEQEQPWHSHATI